MGVDLEEAGRAHDAAKPERSVNEKWDSCSEDKGTATTVPIAQDKLSDNPTLGTPPTIASETTEGRATWRSKAQFMLSAIGYAVGLGNIWRFPYLCYRNGGGAFLIPYFLSLFFIGIPMYLLELAVGQYFRRGAVGAWTSVSPVLKGIGIASSIVAFIVSLYYNVIISWALYYLVVSFQSPLPWQNLTCVNISGSPLCSANEAENFFYRNALDTSEWIEQPGGIVWQQAVCLLVSWLIIWACVIQGIRSSGRAALFTATFPYVLLAIFFFRGVTLPGAGEGIRFFITPQFSRLQDPSVWVEAATQIFYSLNIGFGGVIAFASYNPQKNDCIRDALTIASINSATSIFAGFVVFSIIGHMAHTTGLPVEDVVDEGPGLAFVTFPTAIAAMAGAPVWSVLFFFMLLLLGLDSQFGGIECVVTVIRDSKRFDRFPHWAISGAVCAVSFFIGLLFTSRGGVYFFELFDYYGAALPLLTVSLLEIMAVSWVYGVDRFLDHIHDMTGKRLGTHWWVAYKFLLPALMVLLWVFGIVDTASGSLQNEQAGVDRRYPSWTVGFGWGLIGVSVIWIPVFAWANRSETWASDAKQWLRTRTWAWFRAQLTRPAPVATSATVPMAADQCPDSTGVLPGEAECRPGPGEQRSSVTSLV